MVSVCTIIAGNYLPAARVLADSFFAQHPDGTFTTLLIDDEDRRLDTADPRIDWRRLRDIGLDPREIHRLAGIYEVIELATAVKPRLLRRLRDEGRREVIYLDPDIRIFGSLTEAAMLARGHGIVLTPHTIAPIPRDDRQLDRFTMLAAGAYNLGFIAVGAGSEPFLDWWWQQTRREALMDVTRMMFTDQRWIDYVPSLFEPYLLKDPGYNVAYWNLHARRVTQDDDGRLMVEGVPLRFFHFSGFEIQKPWLLSRHAGDRPRVLLSEHPLLARICQDYAACLRRAGFDADSTRPYGWRTTAAGVAWNSRIRRLYWDGVVSAENGRGCEPPDPFDADAPEAFVAWLNAPPEDGPRRVSRYLYALYRDRPRLQVCFPDLDGVDAVRYADWVWREGIHAEEVPFELLPPHEAEAAPEAEPQNLARGLTIAGSVRSELGIGETARLLTHAADAAQIPYAMITCGPARGPQRSPFDINVVCVNADATPELVRDAGRGFFAGRHTVGYWFWEVDPLPAPMHAAFDCVDEVWVATNYVAGILRAAGRKPVFTMPLPMLMPSHSPAMTREQLGLPNRFIFLVLFDYVSLVARKNPIGAIEAFTTAFAPDEGPVLVVKSINGELHLADRERVRMAAAGRPDVLLLESPFTADEKNGLLAASNCYVSLHRALGFGPGLAEAMALRKPAIATGYSGNLDFMTPENSYLVDYTMSPIPAGCGPYPAGALWAEPDIAHAARLMREVHDRPFDAVLKAARGQADIVERHNVCRSAATLAGRVDAIRSARRSRVVVVAEPDAPLAADEAGCPLEPERAHEREPEGVLDERPLEERPFESAGEVLTREPESPPAPPPMQAPLPMPAPPPMPVPALPSAAAAFEGLVPRLEALGAPRLSADGRRWPTVRLAAQRALFRLLRPYWFQQRQFQDALISALLSSVKTLSGELSRDLAAVETLRAEADALRERMAARVAQVDQQFGRVDQEFQRLDQQLQRVDQQFQQIHPQFQQIDRQFQRLDAAKTETQASLAELSEGLFVAPYVEGRERFVQRASNGETWLGYGSTSGSNGTSNGNGNGGAGDGLARAEPLFRTRHRLYMPLLKHRARVVDIGCGRGAMLDLLRIEKVPAVGIDLDPDMVSHCRANGHAVEQAEPLQFLRRQGDASVAAIFSARMIAHLSFEQLQECLRLCRRRLEIGGLLIAEADPTSTRRISPEIALALCQHAGFEQAHVLFPTGAADHATRQARYAVVATAGTFE